MSSVLALLIPISLFLGFFFVMMFLWAVKKGQYDDLETPAHRILKDDDKKVFDKKENT